MSQPKPQPQPMYSPAEFLKVWDEKCRLEKEAWQLRRQIELLEVELRGHRPARIECAAPLKGGLLRELDVVRATGLSRTSLWRLRQSGDFPKPVKITRRRVGWPAEDVETWIKNRSHGERHPA